MNDTSKGRGTYREYVLPTLAVLEAIATKGKSPGTTALAQEDIYRSAEDRRIAEQERARQAAMEEEVLGFKREEHGFKKAEMERLNARNRILRKALGVPDEEKSYDFTDQPTPKKITQEDVERVLDTIDLQEDPYKFYTGKKEERIISEKEKQTYERQQEKTLRDEFDKKSKVFEDIKDAYVRVEESAKDPSAAGDMALIFNYMKILDPGSTVREGEFATAQNAAGIPERIVSMYNRAINGQRLAPETRQDFVSRSRRLYSGKVRTHQSLIKRYEELSARKGVDPSFVVTPIDVMPGEIVKPKQNQSALEALDELKEQARRGVLEAQEGLRARGITW